MASKKIPLEAILICLYFFMGPFLHLHACMQGATMFNYGHPDSRSFVIYCGISPLAGYLLLVRSPRARFAAYIFFTMEALRSVRGEQMIPILISVAAILALQTGRMREIYPSMMKRWGSRSS